MMRSLTLLFLVLSFSLAQGQTHSVSIFPGDTSACIGNSIRFTATVFKGTFRYIGTYAGKDYFMDTIARSWTDSRSAAQANGMDLWVIDSLNENNAVYNLIPYRGRVDVMFWFGLYQDPVLETAGGPSDGWKWIDGRSLDTTFKYWLFNEPDNAFQTKFPANHAAMGLNTMLANWGDMSDTLPSGFNGYAIAETDAKPFQYFWSNGDRNPSTINVAPTLTTSYSFKVVYGTDTALSNVSTFTVLAPEATANFDFAPGSEFCLEWNKVVFTNSTITANPSNITYSWDFGDGTLSGLVAPTHRYGASQLYAVKLKATDKNGCSTTATKSVTILTAPLPPIITFPTGKNIFCEGDSVTLNTVVVQPDPSVIYKWYRGTDSVFINKPYVAKTAGTYNLVAINSNGCKDTSSVTVTVNALPPKPNLTYGFGFTGVICAIDSTVLTAQPFDPSFKYIWYKAASPFPTQFTQNTRNTNSVYGSSVVSVVPITEHYLLRILDAKNCFSAYSDSISVTTRPSPSSLITTNGKSSTFCEGDSVRLVGSSTSSGNTFAWTSNNVPVQGTDSTFMAKLAGVYRMITTNIYGCGRSSNPIGVFVNKYPAVPTILTDPNVAELLPDGTVSICNGSSTTIRINSIASATYQWYKDNSLITNARNTNLSVNLPGNYKIAVTVNNCTTNSLDQKISVRPIPPGNLVAPPTTILCDGSSLRLDANGSFRYQWYLNNALIPGAVDSTYLTFLPGVYKTEFIDNKGCKRVSSNFVNLNLVKKPSPAFTYDLYCVNTLSNFTNQSQSPNSGSVNYLWRFNNGTTDDAFNTKHVFPDTGLYRVSLSVIPVACPALTDSAVANVRVQSPQKGVSYVPINAEAGKPVGLVARAIGDLYQWRPTTGLNSPFIRIPILNPTTEQLYTVSITNRAGCITTDSILVRIFDEQDVFVAGAFTPNRDGKNDRIYPILVGIDVFNYLKIFNRWGTLVYQSNAIDPAQGWDGTYKGIDQPADTYTWVIDAVGQNGKPIRKSGSIVLIR
jgi:gliding motility-associated-like protein